MSEIENLLKIQEFIDDHKDDVQEGDYLIMVNTLMNAWKNGSDEQEKNKKLINELMQTLYAAEDEYYKESRLHHNTKLRYKTLCKKNESMMNQIVQQKKQIQMLKNSIKNGGVNQSVNQTVNSTIGRCEYLFTKGKFKNELCGSCCDPGKNRCNKH